jgi:hypothetical protein
MRSGKKMNMDRPLIKKTTQYYNHDRLCLGTHRRGRPKNTWIRDLEKDRSNIGKSWRELEILPKDRKTRNVIVTGLCLHES